MNSEIVKCLKCEYILISGNGKCFFSSGVTILCKNCGNSVNFDYKDPEYIDGKVRFEG